MNRNTCNSATFYCYFFILYACLLGHSAVRQTEPRPAIRLSHPVLLHYNKRADIVHDMKLCMFFYDQFKPTNDFDIEVNE